MGNTFTIGIKNYKKLKKEFSMLQQVPERVEKRIVSDFKSRAPGWIADEVVKVYNIRKGEIMPSNGSSGGKSIGSIGVRGKTIASAKLVYQGRLLTLTHFKMSPTEPPNNRSSQYTIKATIKKGERKTIRKNKKLGKKQKKNISKNFQRKGKKNSPSSPPMLLHTGNQKEGGTNYIPFQRMDQRRSDLKAVKTVSMPQMVSNPVVKEKINKVLAVNMGERIDYHMKKYMK